VRNALTLRILHRELGRDGPARGLTLPVISASKPGALACGQNEGSVRLSEADEVMATDRFQWSQARRADLDETNSWVIPG